MSRIHVANWQETDSRAEGRHRRASTPDGVEVKGPKGTLKQRVPPGITFEVKGTELVATTERPDPRARASSTAWRAA